MTPVIQIQVPDSSIDCSLDILAKSTYKRLSERMLKMQGKAQDLWSNVLKWRWLSPYFLNYTAEMYTDYVEYLRLYQDNRKVFAELCKEYQQLLTTYGDWKTSFGESSPTCQRLRHSLKATLIMNYSLCEMCRNHIGTQDDE